MALKPCEVQLGTVYAGSVLLNGRVLQVSLAALALLQVCINICPGVLESNLDKLMPLLFLKLCAGKQSVRSAAEAALQGEYGTGHAHNHVP